MITQRTMTQNISSTDPLPIAIAGAGPVGLACALLLLRAGVPASAIHLFDARTAQQAAQDQRTIALSYGSQQLLASLGAWPFKASPIHDIHVTRQGQFGRSLLRQSDYDLPALGYVASYADIVEALRLRAEASQLKLHRPVSLSAATESALGMQLHSDSGDYLAHFFIQAEGGLFQQQAQRPQHRDYQQSAIIFNLQTDQAQSGRAYERFTAQGPLALLPLQTGYAVVWCVAPERLEGLLALDETAFLAQLQIEFGYRAGRFLSATKRLAFPLGLNAHSTGSAHSVTLGNAAQTLHPVAGQGLNLGLRDAAELAAMLARLYLTQGPSWFQEPEFSQRYLAQRQTDRQLTIRLTDTLARSFTLNQGQSLLGLGLALLDNAAPLRQALARHMLFGWRN